MYIPDRVKIVARNGIVEVFSSDEGHEQDEALGISEVRLYWQISRFTASIEYGAPFARYGGDEPHKHVTVEYDASHATLDIQQ